MGFSNGTVNVTDALGAVRTFSYARKGDRNLAKGISGSQCPTCTESFSTTYDDFGYPAIRQDYRNNETRYVYDAARGLELTRTEAYGKPIARTLRTIWHPAFRLPVNEATFAGGSATGTPLVETVYTHDSSGNVLTRTVTDTSASPTVSRTWTYTYDVYGRVLSEDGPRTDVSDLTTYTYYTCTTGYQCGQVHTVTNALGHITTFGAYNAFGQPLTITDPNGILTTLAYDARQRLTSRTTAGETTTFEYWPTGLLKKVTQADASFLLYTYDAAHRLTGIEDGEGSRIEYVLDAAGNRTAENAYDPSNSLARTQTQVFNNLSRLWKQVGSAGTAAVTTTFGYDNNGNQTSVAAPLSRNTGYQYDELNRLKQITDPSFYTTLFAYDALDHVISVTDPRSKITTYSYTAFGEVKELVSPDTGATLSTYDSAGNLATSTDARGKTGAYTYDALYRVSSLAYPDRTTSFTYDSGTNGVGRLTGASDADHLLTWTYDANGRVTGKTQTVGAVSKSLTYGYTNGNLTSLTTPSGQTISYGYTDGRVTSIVLNGTTTLLNQILYEPFGAVRQWMWGNSTLSNRTYDLDGNPSAIDSAGATSYALDNAFRITGIADLDDSTRSWTYGYDINDRLTSASRTGQTMGFTYDATGNRKTRTGTTTATYTISSTNNRITSISGTPARTYAYDAAGNVTGYGGLTFGYQDSGRMSSVTAASVTTTYTLNALGQRVKKSNTTSTSLFVYDEAGHVLGEYDDTGALVQETVWLHDIPIATLRPNGAGVDVYYVHIDHLNAPRRLSRPADNVIVWRWESDPFGIEAAQEDPDGDTAPVAYNLRFPGQYFDAEGGLHYNYFRDYDPAIGRYVQSDPIGLEGGLNTYTYVDGNPLMYVDPTGESAAGIALPALPGVAAPGAGAAGAGAAGAGAAGAGAAGAAAAAGAVVGAGAVGVGIGIGINKGIEAIFGLPLGVLIYEMCNESAETEEDKLRKRCLALKESILKTCYGLTGRKRMRCYEAANTSFRQCMGYE